MALDGVKVVVAILVGARATGIEGFGEALGGREQELRHDTLDNDVTGSNAAVVVMIEGEVDVKRVVAGTGLLPVVE
jgi:hypothetical protein